MLNDISYHHIVDKSQIPTCNILGVEVAAIDMKYLCNFIEKNYKDLSGDYLCISNVHTTVMAYEDPKYLMIQNGGIMAIPDGGPLSSVGRRMGYTNMQRTFGPEFMEEVLKSGIDKNYRHFFFGSSWETLAKMKENMQNRFPGILIADMYSPPFRPLTEEEDRNIIERINKSNSDFIWVGLGAPKQEIWMSSHQGKVKGFMIGVGAGFDYLAGNIKRAPLWMQKSNLEWLYRLFQDPKRLFKRYLYTNTKFIWEVLIRGKINVKRNKGKAKCIDSP